ncbi:hypothetical protein [Clostridium sp.]|uniref:hypothetical protein n=1 Tax=Clostridium sp. TaxID=1506 RepID=UPI0032162479
MFYLEDLLGWVAVFIVSINAFNMWTLDGEEHIATTSITTNKDIVKNEILVNIKGVIIVEDKYKIQFGKTYRKKLYLMR